MQPPLRAVTLQEFVSVILCGLLTIVLTLPSLATAVEKSSPVPLSDVVKNHGAQLAAVDSNTSALTAFATSIGPALGLRDAAGTVGAKGIPAKTAKELGVAELSLSVQRLIAALAVWQFADTAARAVEPASTSSLSSLVLPTGSREEWLNANGPWSALPDLLRLAHAATQADPSSQNSQMQRMEFALAANRLVFEASQRATTDWWELQGWKDRVRHARGRSRLCGTWQWVIHNHQNHGEQKISMIFLPPGQEKPEIPTPAEIVVLGDSVYLRWEMDGRIQEDSLLFIKDGTRLEGSFVNSVGGWGSITGKRTATCQP